MFWLHRHLLAKKALNSKQCAKGYERIIQDILRKSGYFSKGIVNIPENNAKHYHCHYYTMVEKKMLQLSDKTNRPHVQLEHK